MPSPVGHVLGGLIAGLAVLPAARGRRADQPTPPTAGWPSSRQLLLVSLVACAPDLDFLWGRHNMETHSIGAAALVGLTVLAATRGRAGRLALACTLAVLSHVLFDWLGSDNSPPLGVMALWPLSTDHYFAHAYVFEAISRRYWQPQFVTHNLMAVLRELLILLPPVALLLWWRPPVDRHPSLRTSSTSRGR